MKIGRGSDDKIGRMVVRGTTILLGGRIARVLISLLGIAVLARLLTPAEFGVVAVATMILPLSIALLDGLIDVPTIREDSLDRADLANLIWIGVVLMLGLGSAIWLAAPWLAVLLNSPLLDETLQVLCLGLLAQPFITAGYALLRREHRFSTVAAFVALSGAAYVLSAIAFALVGFGHWSLVIGQFVSLVSTALGICLVSAAPVWPLHQLQVGSAWRLGGMGLATRLLAWMWANIDTLFASGAIGPAGAGIYSRAYNITTQMKEPFAVFDLAMRQAFIAQRELDDSEALRTTLSGLRLVVLAAALLAATVVVLREALVMVLLGPQWTAVTLPLAILACSFPARVARLYLDGFTYTRGSLWQMLLRNIVVTTMLIVGLWVWASEGVEAIALVVAAVHVATLLFRGGVVDVAVAGTRVNRLVAIAPGCIAGAAIVGIGELPSLLLPGTPVFAEWSIRAIVCAISCIFAFVALPDSWLPQRINRQRRRFRITLRDEN